MNSGHYYVFNHQIGVKKKNPVDLLLNRGACSPGKFLKSGLKKMQFGEI